MALTPLGSKKDGWPARVYRSLALSGVMPILGRKRNLRSTAVGEEEMDVLPLNEAGEVKTAPPAGVERLLSEIVSKLDAIHQELLRLR